MISRLVPLLLTLALTAGCGAGVQLETPPGFAHLEKESEYVYRAVNADGIVIAVRAEPNKPFANLDFWADALDRQLRRSHYQPSSKPVEVRSSKGIQGRQLRYTREDQGRTYLYWITVYVTVQHVWCVEAGGDAERFTDKVQERVKQAMDSVVFG